ncbi:MAG: hypothetical protein ACXW5U_03870 [Thermoanaerobaculia bacterium]
MTITGYPANDWQLTANDSASGGSSKFSIEDITGSKVPFTVRAGAASNSIYVDSTGRVGFRTSTPVLDLHVNTGNTPAIRLEQNSSGGWGAQTWGHRWQRGELLRARRDQRLEASAAHSPGRADLVNRHRRGR